MKKTITRRVYRALSVALLASVLLLPAGGTADSASSVEYRVKAAYLYNFTRFVEWPDDAEPTGGEHIVVCVLGKDPFGESLDSIAGKKVRGKRLSIQRTRSAKRLDDCHVVFVDNSERARMGRILMDLRKRPVLTVGETTNFNQLGGIIQFTLVNNKVRFNINPDAARRARLTISSKLLNLATIVRESRP